MSKVIFNYKKNPVNHILVWCVMTSLLAKRIPNIYEAAMIAFGIGIVKEIYDFYKPNPTGFNVYDILCDVVGIAIAVVALGSL